MSADIIGSSTETVQHLIKNIFRNIKAVVFKLGTRNAQKNKMTPVVAFVPLFMFLFKLNFSDSPVPFQRVRMGIFGFSQKETGAESVDMATTWKVSFCFFCDVHFWCQV